MAAIKQAYEKAQGEEESEPAAKKVKSELSEKVEAYGVYKKMTADVLKDMLGWNHQVKSGNKDFIIFKCIDGHVNGRLALCPLCTGKACRLLIGRVESTDAPRCLTVAILLRCRLPQGVSRLTRP